METRLPPAGSVLAVCAHPDDESFGLGAILTSFREAGARISLLTFTRGEASTLHGAADVHDLAAVRPRELEAAAGALGLERADLLEYPDGALSQVPLDELAAYVVRVATDVAADLLLVFDLGGISGHPDHQRATEAALTTARAATLPVLAFALPCAVAETLNAEFGTTFVGRDTRELDVVITVDRTVQRQAIECHASQASTNPGLWRRLELLGAHEWLRSLSADPAATSSDTTRH
jgi:LmbE family N-acetylglucosaminyl deacetylase